MDPMARPTRAAVTKRVASSRLNRETPRLKLSQDIAARDYCNTAATTPVGARTPRKEGARNWTFLSRAQIPVKQPDCHLQPDRPNGSRPCNQIAQIHAVLEGRALEHPVDRALTCLRVAAASSALAFSSRSWFCPWHGAPRETRHDDARQV